MYIISTFTPLCLSKDYTVSITQAYEH